MQFSPNLSYFKSCNQLNLVHICSKDDPKERSLMSDTILFSVLHIAAHTSVVAFMLICSGRLFSFGREPKRKTQGMVLRNTSRLPQGQQRGHRKLTAAFIYLADTYRCVEKKKDRRVQGQQGAPSHASCFHCMPQKHRKN